MILAPQSLTFREQCEYRVMTWWNNYSHAEALQKIFSERLDRMVEANRTSFRIQDYAKRREAAKLGLARRQADRAGQASPGACFTSPPYGDHPSRVGTP